MTVRERTRGRWRWPLWLLLSVVLLALPALAWAARAWWPGWGAMLGGLDVALCDLPGGLQQLERDSQTLLDEERTLRRDLATAEERVLARRAACRSPAPAQVAQQTPPPQPSQAPPDDLERRLQRENAQRGELNVSLAWDTRDDLDLWIICPDGSHVSWTNRSGCRATLDVDANAGRGDSTQPVENIFWTRIADGPPGRYRIEIENFAGGPNRWRVRVTAGGRTCDFQGEIGRSRTRITVAELTLPEGTVQPCPAAAP